MSFVITEFHLLNLQKPGLQRLSLQRLELQRQALQESGLKITRDHTYSPLTNLRYQSGLA